MSAPPSPEKIRESLDTNNTAIDQWTAITEKNDTVSHDGEDHKQRNSTNDKAEKNNDSTNASHSGNDILTNTKNKKEIEVEIETKESILTKIRRWCVTIPSIETLPANKNYEAFKNSNYVYFLGGRLRNTKRFSHWGKHIKLPILPFTVALVIFPFVIFLIFEAGWFWHHVSPGLVILFCYCWCLTFVNLIKAAFLDPGALPKNIHIVDGVQRYGLPDEYHSWLNLPGPTDKNGNVHNVYMKYCDTCYIWRPVRASHCSRCGVCVENMDHHCPWLGNCVGQRNYWYFINFVIFAVLSCFFLATMSFYKVGKHGLYGSKWSLFLGIFVTCLIPYSVLLLFYHLSLGLTGITTREYLNAEIHQGNNRIQDACMDPFNSKNLLKNLKRQWFRPRGSSNISVVGNLIGDDDRFTTFHIGAV